MSESIALIQQTISYNNTHEVMRLRRQAAIWFRNGRFTAKWHHFGARITGRDVRLKNLNDVSAASPLQQHQQIGIREVPIHLIQGSEGRSDDFDQQFRPLRTHNKDRWINIAVARYQGVQLPAVDLVQVGCQFFVRDGHHRISVAHLMGQATIDASVTIWGGIN